jgi:hypothetical protein
MQVTTARPPQYFANPYYQRRQRWLVGTGAANFSIGIPNILASLGVVRTLTTAGWTVNCSFRVKRVRLWGPSAGGTISIQWADMTSANNYSFGAPREISDSSTSTAYVSHIDTRPPTRSAAAFWQVVPVSGSSPSLFNVAAPTGTIIDIDFDLVHADGINALGQPVTIVTGVTGNTLYPPLDGVGGVIIPVSLALT